MGPRLRGQERQGQPLIPLIDPSSLADRTLQVEWHVPSPVEIDFALELLREIVSPALDTIEKLLREPTSPPTPSWANDFCRYCNIVRSALSGIPSLMWMPPPTVPGAVASDAGFVPAL